ncbi:MAG TPA: ABC transporter substrate-binding protein [Kofleriaceae bacterium]|nr:ABC transporter substrate-binding protein [Kofleriaceae bacterium]
MKRAPQVALVGAIAAIAIGTGCDSPARVKPWRHAPDPTAEAKSEPASQVLSNLAGQSDGDLRANRPHTLRIDVDAEPGRLTPLVEPSVWARRITLGTIFEPLLRYVPPETGQGPGRYEPRLARSWRVMPGGQEIRVELEPDVKFHDGTRMTTSDVQFTLDAVRTPHKGLEHLRAMLDDIEAIELVTPTELNIELKKPSGWVLRALAEVPILPMHVYDGSLLAGGALIGTGPWKLVSNRGGVVHLGRFDKYWGTPAPIADVEFVYQPDAAIALIAAKRGELDIVPALIPAHWPEQATSPGVAASFQPLVLAPPRLRYLAFNAARAPLDDARVRHALALLVDRRAIAKRVFGGLARPALWPIWPGGPVDGAEAPVPELDPATAGKLLDAAGWTDRDGDGIRDKDGKQLRLVLIGAEHAAPDPGNPAKKTERDYFVEAAKRIGVVIEVKSGGESFIDKRTTDGSWDIVEDSWAGLADGPLDGVLASAATPDSAIRTALDALGAAWDPAEREKLAPELASALADSWPIAGIVADAPQGLASRRLRNVRAWEGWIDLSVLSFGESP